MSTSPIFNKLMQSETFRNAWLDMLACNEDTTYHHGESSAEHSATVVDSLRKLSVDFPKERQERLEMLGWLHDLGKPSCRRFDTTKNKIVFNGHPESGVNIARQVLSELGVQDDILLALIGNHMNIFQALKTGQHAFLAKPGRIEILEDLALMAKADGMAIGRDEAKQIDQLLDTVQQQVNMRNNTSKKKTFIMPIGISGSGKSTFMRKRFDPRIIVEPDAIRREVTGSTSDQSQDNKVWAIVRHRILSTLEEFGKCVLDATNVRSRNRKPILDMLPGNTEKIAMVFEADPAEVKRRIRADIAGGVDRSNVPDDVIDRQHAFFKQDYALLSQQFDRVVTIKNKDI